MRLYFVFLLFYGFLPTVLAIKTRCYISSNDTVPELIAKCRDKQIISKENRNDSFSLKGISQTDFDAIFSNKPNVNVPFEFVETMVTDMVFPLLVSYLHLYGKLYFCRNSHLRLLSFPTPADIQGNVLEISHNPMLEQLDVKNLHYFLPKIFELKNNSILRSFEFQSLRLSLGNEIGIINNPSLESIKFGFDDSINLQPLVGDRTIFKISKKLIIRDNPSLTEVRIELPKPYEIEIGGMEIVNNRALVELPTNFKNDKIGMKIRGNPQLRREILERLRAKANDSDIQEYGECLFQEPVTELSALDVCVYVYGNLTLAGGGRTVTRLTRVEGDVSTGRVAIDSLDFLLDTDIYGKFESDLCDFDYSLFKSSKKGVRKRCQEMTTRGTKATRATTTMREATTEKEITGKTTTEGRTEGETRMTRAKETTERREESTEEAKEPSTAGGRDETTTGETERSTVAMGSEQLEQTTRRKEEEKSSFPLIPLLAGLLLLLLLIIITATIFYYRNKKKKTKETEKSTKSENDQSGSQISRRKE